MNEQAAAEAVADPLVRRTERTLAGVRLLTGVWAIFMVITYPDYPASHEAIVKAWALGLVVAFLVGAIALWLAMELRSSAFEPARWAAIGLGLDLAVATGVSFAFGFDRLSAVWIILFLLPVEGAMRFQLRGAVWTLGISSVGYLAREIAWARWIDEPADFRSAIFRLTVVAVVAAFVGIVSEQLRAEREVARGALRRAEASDFWRSRLVSALGHDLRSPLGLIEMQAQAIDQMELSARDRSEMLKGIIRQARRLTRLGEGLLDMAVAQEAKLEIRPVSTSASQLVDDAVDCLGLTDVTVDVDADLLLTVDPDRIEQVLINLLGNARKYGASPIEVTAVRSGAEALMTVRDHGDGVDPNLRARIFDAFEAGGAPDAVGLGLWLVATIVHAHGGSIEIEDAAPGARFVVRLPQPTRLPAEVATAAGKAG